MLALIRGAAVLASVALCGSPVPVQCGEAVAHARYHLDTIVPPSAMHGVHGLAFGPDGALYGASIVGNSLYRIDVRSGAVKTFVGPPEGGADDLAFSTDGTVYWSAESYDAVLFRGRDGKIKT